MRVWFAAQRSSYQTRVTPHIVPSALHPYSRPSRAAHVALMHWLMRRRQPASRAAPSSAMCTMIRAWSPVRMACLQTLFTDSVMYLLRPAHPSSCGYRFAGAVDEESAPDRLTGSGRGARATHRTRMKRLQRSFLVLLYSVDRLYAVMACCAGLLLRGAVASMRAIRAFARVDFIQKQDVPLGWILNAMGAAVIQAAGAEDRRGRRRRRSGYRLDRRAGRRRATQLLRAQAGTAGARSLTRNGWRAHC